MPLLTVNPHARPAIVAEVQRLMACGESLRRACSIAKCSPASYLRWCAKVAETGTVADGKATGREGLFDTMTDDEVHALRHWVLRRGSLPLAIEDFANDPACTVETRTKLEAMFNRAAETRKPLVIPPSLRRAGAVSEEEHALYRGNKTASQYDVIERRALTWVDAEGRILPMAPNSIWESDDMSTNEPFSFVGPDGMTVGRQSLFTCDVFAAKWLGMDVIGRERDAYRVEDIADHMRELVLAWGLPLCWRLERGVWENNWLHGIDLGNGQVFGSLSALFNIDHTWRTRGKGTVEKGFDLLQDMMAGASTTIGRKRGEFEKGTKLYLRAQKGDPEAIKQFWSAAQYADYAVQACDRFNKRPKQRLAHGQDMVVPDELYGTPARRECPEDQLWRFHPVKKITTVRNNAIEVTESVHYKKTFRFRVCGLPGMTYLPHGLRVAIAFHPGYPERGMHVFNADATALNRDGWPMLHPLVVGEYMPLVHNLDLSNAARDFSGKKRASAAMRGEFRQIVSAGTAGHKVSTARDGTGNALVMASGTPLSTGGKRPNHDEALSMLGGLPDAAPARRTTLSDLEQIEALEKKLKARAGNPLEAFS